MPQRGDLEKGPQVTSQTHLSVSMPMDKIAQVIFKDQWEKMIFQLTDKSKEYL